MEAPTVIAYRWMYPVAVASLAAGVVCRVAGAGIAALWLFVAAAVALAFALPFAYALVSPLFMGLVGWLVDMLPFVILAGWGAVVLRWLLTLAQERRLARGGRWIWLPIGLLAWTGLGILVVPRDDLKHFVLLFGIQLVASGVLLAVVDSLNELADHIRVVTSLVVFVLVLTVGVSLQYFGVPLESLQDETVSDRAEEAYGVDAFRATTGMIKYARARDAGVGEWRRKLRTFQEDNPTLPPFTVFLPRFDTYEESVLIRFEGSARSLEDDLRARDVELLNDNVAVAPANLVPRWRSFPRNSLTYAGLCAALFPLALFLTWNRQGATLLIGRFGAAACLAGAAFSLARGAWVAILVGIAYLAVDGLIPGRRKIAAAAAFAVAAVSFTALFLIKYEADPLTARAGGESSIQTREDLYEDTVETVTSGPQHLLLGFGTEIERVEGAQIGGYVPPAGTHSTYLNYLFRTGIIGAIAIVAIYLLAGLHARAASRSLRGEARDFTTAVSVSIVVIAAHAMILSLYVEPAYTLVISLILGLGIAGATSLPRSIVPWRDGEPAHS